jgi:nicotinamide-nucleotide amidase
MSAAILCIGTELTRGELVNSNATWLADAVTGLGLEVTELACTDDDPERIQAALGRMAREHELIVCTGGLGPTTDDLTTECVAALLGVPLERDAASLEAIRARMERFGRTMAMSNAKQADFPRGSRVLPNRYGTAPGFSVQIERALSFFLPGVPLEMRGLFEEYVAAAATSLVRDRVEQIVLRTFGMTESAVNDRLAGIAQAHAVTLAYRAHYPEIEVKVLARGASADDAQVRACAAAEEIRARLGDIVYGEGRAELPQVVGTLLAQRGLTFGTAESCTGGLVAALLTEHAGSSAFFKGSAITYSNALKEALLGVEAALVSAHGAVSKEVACSMARGALSTLDVNVSLALTGIAGPAGGTLDKPVGLVHLAVATSAGITHQRVDFPGTRAQIRKLSAYRGLALVRQVILHGHV